MNFLLCFSSHFFDIKIIFATWMSSGICPEKNTLVSMSGVATVKIVT